MIDRWWAVHRAFDQGRGWGKELMETESLPAVPGKGDQRVGAGTGERFEYGHKPLLE